MDLKSRNSKVISIAFALLFLAVGLYFYSSEKADDAHKLHPSVGETARALPSPPPPSLATDLTPIPTQQPAIPTPEVAQVVTPLPTIEATPEAQPHEPVFKDKPKKVKHIAAPSAPRKKKPKIENDDASLNTFFANQNTNQKTETYNPDLSKPVHDPVESETSPFQDTPPSTEAAFATPTDKNDPGAEMDDPEGDDLEADAIDESSDQNTETVAAAPVPEVPQDIPSDEPPPENTGDSLETDQKPMDVAANDKATANGEADPYASTDMASSEGSQEDVAPEESLSPEEIESKKKAEKEQLESRSPVFDNVQVGAFYRYSTLKAQDKFGFINETLMGSANFGAEAAWAREWSDTWSTEAFGHIATYNYTSSQNLTLESNNGTQVGLGADIVYHQSADLKFPLTIAYEQEVAVRPTTVTATSTSGKIETISIPQVGLGVSYKFYSTDLLGLNGHANFMMGLPSSQGNFDIKSFSRLKVGVGAEFHVGTYSVTGDASFSTGALESQVGSQTQNNIDVGARLTIPF